MHWEKSHKWRVYNVLLLSGYFFLLLLIRYSNYLFQLYPFKFLTPVRQTYVSRPSLPLSAYLLIFWIFFPFFVSFNKTNREEIAWVDFIKRGALLAWQSVQSINPWNWIYLVGEGISLTPILYYVSVNIKIYFNLLLWDMVIT